MVSRSRAASVRTVNCCFRLDSTCDTARYGPSIIRAANRKFSFRKTMAFPVVPTCSFSRSLTRLASFSSEAAGTRKLMFPRLSRSPLADAMRKLSVLTACRPSTPKIRFTHLSMGLAVSSETANAVRLVSDGMPLTGTVAAGQGISMRGYCAASMTGMAYSAFPEETTSFPFFIWKVTRSPSSRRSIPERSGAFTTTLPSRSICAGSCCSNAISRFPDATVSASCSACKYAHCRISIVETLGAMRSAFCAAASSSVRLTVNFIASSFLRNGIK